MDGNQHKPTNHTAFVLHMVESDTGDGSQVGGLCRIFKAGATLLVGDNVYLSAAHTVNKSLVAATVLGKVQGVVVGGYRTDMRAVTRKLDVGAQAALVNEPVLVMFSGKFWTVSDAAITVGDIITTATATTAGRVKTGTVTTDLAAGDTGRILGNALEAAGGAGITIMAVYNLK